MQADLFSEREGWKKPVAVSAGLHGLFAAFLVVAGYVSGARGQTWGGDASGAAVPGAQVVVSNESNGIKRTMDTTEAGVFAAPSLVPAMGYTVSVNSTGAPGYTISFTAIGTQTDDGPLTLSNTGVKTPAGKW